MDKSQNSYGGTLACSAIGLLYGYMSLHFEMDQDTLESILKDGSEIWRQWLNDGSQYSVMQISDILKFYPNMLDDCKYEEHGGNSLEMLQVMYDFGMKHDASGSITTVCAQYKSNESNMTGYSYGISFINNNTIRIFDSHPPYAKLIQCHTIKDMLNYIYKDQLENLIYSSILFYQEK